MSPFDWKDLERYRCKDPRQFCRFPITQPPKICRTWVSEPCNIMTGIMESFILCSYVVSQIVMQVVHDDVSSEVSVIRP